VKLLLDEMYADKLAQALRDRGIDAATVAELGMAGWSDADVFIAAADEGYVLLTENVSDFARLCGDHVAAGRHHCGVLIALSSRFSRRPAGNSEIVKAIAAVAAEQLDDRLVYLEDPLGSPCDLQYPNSDAVSLPGRQRRPRRLQRASVASGEQRG
jgi:hypothetical protein